MSDIKLNDSLTSDDNMGENDFFQNINNIVNLNSDDSNIHDSPMPVPQVPVSIPVLVQTQPKQSVPVPVPVPVQVQTQPKPQVLVKTQPKPPVLVKTQTQPKPSVPVPVPNPVQTQPEPQLTEKSVTFNEVVEQKEITPTSQQVEVTVLPLVSEIKKIKIGKLLVPRVTVLFVIVLILIGVGLFYATKPKKQENKQEDKKDTK